MYYKDVVLNTIEKRLPVASIAKKKVIDIIKRGEAFSEFCHRHSEFLFNAILA